VVPGFYFEKVDDVFVLRNYVYFSILGVIVFFDNFVAFSFEVCSCDVFAFVACFF